MAKRIIQKILNPKYGQSGEPRWLEIPPRPCEDGEVLAFLNTIGKIEVNITQITNKGYGTFIAALGAVTDERYKVNGIILTYYNTTSNRWMSKRFNGKDSSEWYNILLWSNYIDKKTVEDALYGNVTSHTHDTTYTYKEYEVDVWDGTTISTSIQGEGTKENPYLINSCADWIYFWDNAKTYMLDTTTEGMDVAAFSRFVKVTKSLDFDNLPVVYKSQDVAVLFDVDGCGITISNFIINGTNLNDYGIANTTSVCWFHNFNLVDIVVNCIIDTTDSSSGGGIDFFSKADYGVLTNIYTDNYIKGKIVFSGNVSESFSVMMTQSGIGMYGFTYFPTLLKNVFSNTTHFFGVDIAVEDNSVKSNDAKILLARYTVFDIEGNLNLKSIGYDATASNFTDLDAEENPLFSEGDVQSVMLYRGNPNDVYLCSERASAFIHSINLSESSLSAVKTQGKTLAELNSESFIRDVLNKEEEFFRAGKETPILAQLAKTIDYEGYVKKSEFEEVKSKISNFITLDSVYLDIDLDLTDTIKNLKSKEQRGFFGKTYDVITNENIIDKLGGVEGIRKLFKKLSPLNRPPIVCIPVFVYIVPIRMLFTQNGAGLSSSKGGSMIFYNQEIPDGSYVSLAFGSIFGNVKFQVNIAIENFNLSTMAATIERVIE